MAAATRILQRGKENLPPLPPISTGLLPAIEIVTQAQNILENEARRARNRALRRLGLIVLTRRVPTAVSLFGWRRERERPLEDSDLWVDGIAPHEQRSLHS
ncbi:hypothetical protein R3P38DRAFT_2781706 [Favolaschia claudopus]|uniref:Uncharacterized protein n=1 Tax=Favolaschia claudopus TaxID=2862362 RepID=A0AAW0B2U9_9AGAR